MWVDAVCINQRDNNEKAWQVAQMQRVYSQASSVIIWLGLPADGSNIAINTLLAMRSFALRASGYVTEGKSNVEMHRVPVDRSDQAIKINLWPRVLVGCSKRKSTLTRTFLLTQSRKLQSC